MNEQNGIIKECKESEKNFIVVYDEGGKALSVEGKIVSYDDNFIKVSGIKGTATISISAIIKIKDTNSRWAQ